jgi:ABC-type polysaccharide/polyol phosphate export permease
MRTVKNFRTCLQWAWLDVVCHYRRSRIGPLWETINILVMVLGLSVVSSAVIGGDVTDLIGYIGLGIIIWTAISALFMEGATTFVRNAGPDAVPTTTIR